jgi:flavin reductase (DIM6/NTAB) family NADH-FMN oxidoreductase RutF
MISVEPKDIPVAQAQSYLLGGVGPRPIALVSTLSPNGAPNLAPFSFYNAFGANPPTIAFSPSRRVRDNTTKDTLGNLQALGECVVQAVTYSMVQQVNVASMEYPPDVDEFAKSGLTPMKSDLVKPFRVAESPFQMECRVQQIIELGGKAGSGNLVICEVVKFHVDEKVFVSGVIEPDRIGLVARMSADYYVRGHGHGLFTVEKPGKRLGIGYDNLPEFIRYSNILTANHLGQLASVTEIPSKEQVEQFLAAIIPLPYCPVHFYEYEALGDYEDMARMALASDQSTSPGTALLLTLAAARALDMGDITFGWKALLIGQQLVEKNV